MIDKDIILNFLGDCSVEYNLNVFNEIGSTNDYIRLCANNGAKQGLVAIAEQQTAGRGRKGRSFISPCGGLYLSLLLSPQTDPQSASLITCAAAVAVCKTIEEISSQKAEIKWVNDIFINGKKACGILTESKINAITGHVDYVVLGIGINVFTPDDGFSEEIKNIAASVFDVKSEYIREKTAASLLKKLCSLLEYSGHEAYIDEYIKRSCVIGKRVNVYSGENSIPAEATGIDNDCRLIVKYSDGRIEALSSGEVSIRTVEK